MTVRRDLHMEPALKLALVADSVRVYAGGAYPGPYDVTPTAGGFELETKDLAMADNVTIEPIPVVRAGNEQGGITCSIAS